jgi:hypothetical protein
LKPVFTYSLLSALALSLMQIPAARAQQGTPAPASSTKLQGILLKALTTPSAEKGSAGGSSSFTPSGEKLSFLSGIKLDESRKVAFRKYAEQVMTMVEGAYAEYGYSKNDLGVAFGGLLETCYEMDKGTYKASGSTPEEKQKTKAVVAQMQTALGNSPAFQSLPDTNKQIAYESATFLIGHLGLQWQQAGSDATKKEAVQQMARQQIKGIFGLNPEGLTRLASGAFTKTGSSIASKATPAIASKAGKTVPTPVTKNAAVSTVPMPTPSLGGARIFMKYRLSYYPAMTTSFDHLILFPDGTAFDDIPGKPMSQFSAATLKSMLKPRDIGTWKQSGNKIVLNFPANTREPQRILLKREDGWYDGKELPKKSTSYDTYYPVTAPSKQHLVGAWKSSSLTTMGMAGGGAPMVAAGSNSDRVFHADGTFSDAKKSFASATTSNMGDAFKTGGDVTTTSNKNKSGMGRWRIDGPLLTMEQNGQRTVHIAFIMPHWSKDPKSQSDIMIDGDNWEHPDK